MAYSIKNRSFASFCILFVFILGCEKDKIETSLTEINSPTSFDLSCIKFANDTGFACGGSLFDKSILLRTTDAGITWQNLPLPLTNEQNKKLVALDVLNSGELQVAGFGGITLRSADFGNTLSFQQEPRFYFWTGLAYRTNNEAYLCGQDGLKKGYINSVKRSAGWIHPFLESSHSFGMNDIQFFDSLHGYIAGFGAIYKTTDGGKLWQFTNAKNDNFTSTVWFSRQEGVAVGWEGTIAKTDDGGMNWDNIRSANRVGQRRVRLKCITKNNKDELIAAGEKGCILYSNDKGQSWKEIQNVPKVNLESVCFQNEQTFFAVGEEGRIFKIIL